MLYHAAAVRREKRQRRDRIYDIGAGTNGGDFAKKLLASLQD